MLRACRRNRTRRVAHVARLPEEPYTPGGVCCAPAGGTVHAGWRMLRACRRNRARRVAHVARLPRNRTRRVARVARLPEEPYTPRDAHCARTGGTMRFGRRAFNAGRRRVQAWAARDARQLAQGARRRARHESLPQGRLTRRREHAKGRRDDSATPWRRRAQARRTTLPPARPGERGSTKGGGREGGHHKWSERHPSGPWRFASGGRHFL